jgi:aminopeptidase N
MAFEHRLHARCGGACHDHHGAHALEGGGGAAGGRPFAFSGSPRHFERDRPFAVEHIGLDLRLIFAEKSVEGTATLRLRRVDPDATAIELDAIGFTLRAVTVDGKEAPYVYDGRVLRVDVPTSAASVELSVRYHATPRRGLYFLEPDDLVPQRPRQAWTQLQEEDARHVFPCHDKPHVKMTTEARVRVPTGFHVLSNGDLVGRERVRAPDGTDEELFHWHMRDPHPSYLVTIVAGEFDEIAELVQIGEGSAAKSVPLTYLVPKGREEDGRRTFAKTPEMVRLFSELTGVPYPWSKYAQVVVSDFIFGGMENTSATTMYEHILVDARAALDVTSDDLIAHELAHQWFGDFVTCRDWSEGWLNEGFATFFEHVWREKDVGHDEYDWGIKNDLHAYLGEAAGRYRRPIVCQDYDAPLDLFDRHLYEKGGLVLHVLRTELGDALFWKGIRAYLARHGRSIVETRDLVRALEEVSGRSLGRRVEELVYRAGHPEVDVQVSWANGVLTCEAKQTQQAQDGVPAVFEVPLVLELVEDDDGCRARRERFVLRARTDTFAIPCPKRPRFVVVDPSMNVLGSVTVKAPADMVRRQLAEASTGRGRWLAAQALARFDDPVSIEALGARLRDEDEFWGVRAECAAALAHVRSREGEATLIAATSIAHPKVRRAVVSALGNFRTTRALEALRAKALRDPSYLVEAEAARAIGRTRQVGAFDILVDVMDRPSWADVVASASLDGLAALRDERGLPHLMARTRYGHPSRVRRAAALAIPKIAGDRRAREHLEEMLDDADPILRIDVVRALADLGDARARAALRARAEIDLDPRVRRRIREVVRDLGSEKKIGDQLKEDVEKLGAEHAELRARLAKLEARLGAEGKEAAAAREASSAAKRTLRSGAGGARKASAKGAKRSGRSR